VSIRSADATDGHVIDSNAANYAWLHGQSNLIAAKAVNAWIAIKKIAISWDTWLCTAIRRGPSIGNIPRCERTVPRRFRVGSILLGRNAEGEKLPSNSPISSCGAVIPVLELSN